MRCSGPWWTASGASHEGPPDSPTITDPEQIAKREARKREYERVAAARLGKEAAE